LDGPFPINGGINKVCSRGSWKTLGATANGEIRKKLLPASYTFGMTYGTALAKNQKDTATEQMVVFQLP
jgi:hypothetical protein